MDNNKFIYVFNEKDMNMLSNNGYHMIKADPINGIYIFINKTDKVNFNLGNIRHVMSDILTF